MTIPFEFENTTQPQLRDVRRALCALAGVKLSDAETRRVWPRIQNHKWYVSERLGRDVGLRVAAVDYFENIHEPRRSTLVSQLRRLSKTLAANYLTHQTWKAHDGVFANVPEGM